MSLFDDVALAVCLRLKRTQGARLQPVLMTVFMLSMVEAAAQPPHAQPVQLDTFVKLDMLRSHAAPLHE